MNLVNLNIQSLKPDTMKKYLVFCLMAFFVPGLSAQQPITLNFDTHALKNESKNEMKLCKYADPGNGGENVIWNFSALEELNNFTGNITSSYHSVNNTTFPDANTDLEEFNNHFYFRVEDNRIEQLGYTTNNNSDVVILDKPFVKMQYPFTYGNEISGKFSGIETVNNTTGSINGFYKIAADGYGTLILPGNFMVENTLRIKTSKIYEREINSNSQKLEIITYRWYTKSYRYPLLVLTQIKSGVNTSTQAAFNNDVSLPLDFNTRGANSSNVFEVFPNPADKYFTIQFNLDEETTVNFDVFDLSGKKLLNVCNSDMISGWHSIRINLPETGLTKGSYLLKATIGNTVQTQEIIIL